jgi:hypothetical protein
MAEKGDLIKCGHIGKTKKTVFKGHMGILRFYRKGSQERDFKYVQLAEQVVLIRLVVSSIVPKKLLLLSSGRSDLVPMRYYYCSSVQPHHYK